ncbi:hypothetical protein ACIQMR_31810 [Streptomyces sp. NPDC091376]|uniref:hypothetical protein n=1 Tax=Streptomyces sp. NPDC091376 TaxID=3365994 RepID=UPI003813CC6F
MQLVLENLQWTTVVTGHHMQQAWVLEVVGDPLENTTEGDYFLYNPQTGNTDYHFNSGIGTFPQKEEYVGFAKFYPHEFPLEVRHGNIDDPSNARVVARVGSY